MITRDNNIKYKNDLFFLLDHYDVWSSYFYYETTLYALYCHIPKIIIIIQYYYICLFSLLDFQVRLVGTSLPFAGAIEVSYYGVWGAIWGHSIDVRVGRVICHQLGYSDAQQVFRKSVFGFMKSPFLVKGISCNGNETAISQCTILTIDDRNYWYYFHPGYGAGVQCVESDQVEISKGAN